MVKKQPRHFIFDLSRALLDLSDPFEAVRAFGKTVVRHTGATHAVLSWPDVDQQFGKPIRLESLGKPRATKKHPAEKPLMDVRFSDGELTFIKITFFGTKPFPGEIKQLLRQGTQLVNQTVASLQKIKHQEESRRFESIRTLSAGIGHELNTPLSTLFFYLKALQKQSPADPNLDKLRASAEQVRDIVAKFRAFTGDGDLETPQLFSLEQIFQNVRAKTSALQNHDVQITFDTAIHSSEFVRTRANQLETAIHSLIQNSVESLTRNPVSDPWVRVSVESDGIRVKIRVSDNGAGVPISHRSAVFDPFFSTKDVNEGFGLGLSVARAIAFAHNGTLFLNPLSTFTQFVLELPLDTEASQLKKGA